MKKILFYLVLIALLVGCYKSDETSKFLVYTEGDSVLRLNTKTGEIVVFSPDGIQKYDDDYIQERYKQNSILIELKTDESKTFPESDNVMWTKMRYKWRNDRILYEYTFGPYSSDLEKIFNDSKCNITIIFLDTDGFQVINKEINLSLLTRIVDDNGEPSLWQKTGEVSCSKDDYKLISSYTYLWNFSNMAKVQIKKHSKNIEKERKANYAKIKKLIEEKKVFGKIEANRIYLKNRDGFQEIKENDYDLVTYIINNTESFRTMQNELVKNEEPRAELDPNVSK